MQISKNVNFDHYLGFNSLVLTLLLFLLVFTLNFSKHGCNGKEKEEPCFDFRIIHMFVHACELCCEHSSSTFARRMGEGCNFELGV